MGREPSGGAAAGCRERSSSVCSRGRGQESRETRRIWDVESTGHDKGLLTKSVRRGPEGGDVRWASCMSTDPTWQPRPSSPNSRGQAWPLRNPGLHFCTLTPNPPPYEEGLQGSRIHLRGCPFPTKCNKAVGSENLLSHCIHNSLPSPRAALKQ